MNKRLRPLVLALALAASCVTQASALEFTIDGADDGELQGAGLGHAGRGQGQRKDQGPQSFIHRASLPSWI